jgi:hypothetical protein
MDNVKQAILKIGADAYRSGSDGTFKAVIDTINERASEMEGWTPEMYVMLIKEIQKATNIGFDVGVETGLKKYGQRQDDSG